MRSKLVWSVVSAALVLAVSAPAPAQERAPDAPIAAPYLNGTQIRALRASGAAEVVRFELSVERQVDGEASALEQRRITLGPNYVDAETAGELRVYDFALDRFFYVGPGDDFLQSLSLYGDVAFRHHEIMNRSFMRQALAGTSVATPITVDQYHVEAELGIETPGIPPVSLGIGRQGRTVTVRRDQEVLAELSLSPRQRAGAAKAMFLRYLAYELPIHPQIMAIISDAATEPQSMMVEHMVGGTAVRSTFKLGGWETTEGDYPLRATLRAGAPADQSDDQLRRYLAAVLPLVTGAEPPPTLAELMAEARLAADALDTVGAVATVFSALQRSLSEINQCIAAGDSACTAIAPLLGRLYEDPAAAGVALAVQVDQSDGRAVARAVATLSAIDFDRHHNGPTLNVALANNIVVAKRHQTFDASVLGDKPDDPIELFLRGIEHAPHIANYQKDLADAFHRSFEMPAAWIVFDLARALPGRQPGDLLAPVNEYEASLRRAYPAYFAPG